MKNMRALEIAILLVLTSLACNVLTPVSLNPSTESSSASAETSNEFTSSSLAGLVYGIYDQSANERSLWQIGADGQAQMLISGYNFAAFSPDGKQAAYTKFNEGVPECTWLVDFSVKKLQPLDCSSFTGEDLHTPNYVIGWIPNQPDGVYALINGGWSPMAGYQGYLGTISLTDGVTKTLDAKNEITSNDIELSPDGQMVAYHHGIYSSELGYQDFDVTEYGVDGVYSPSNPSWSPDGEKIAWGILSEEADAQTQQATFGIFDLTDKTAKILFSPFIPTRGGETYATAVPYGVWSPDSEWLAVSSSAQTKDGNYDSANSGWRMVKLNSDNEYEYKIKGEFDSWSPNSQWILYTDRAENDVNILELWISRPNGSEAIKLGEPENFYPTKLWSLDGHYLVFIDGKNMVQLVELGSWETRDITEQFNSTGTPSEINLVDWVEPLNTSFAELTTLPTPTAQPMFSCPNAPQTRLKVGDTARVTYTDGSTTRLRSAPESGDNGVDQLPEGTEFEIIGGPVCYPRPERNDSYVYWEISVPSRGVRGWVAEGDLNNYYIELWP